MFNSFHVRKSGFLILTVLLIIFSGCSKSSDKGTPGEEFPISNLVMPVSSVIYKPGQTISISGQGFTSESKIIFRDAGAAEGGSEASDLLATSYNITFVTPSVYGEQKVILKENSKEWQLGSLTFEAKAPDPGKQTTISQYADSEWDGTKRAGVFYEIFVRSFADSDGDGIGDLNGITAKLDYLDDLGVAGIWLTPIFPSPSYHGYDATDYDSVNPAYGTMADFEKLVAEAHKRNIRVILDFVLNHTSTQHPWFVQACSSVTDQYRKRYLFSKNPESDIAAGLIPMIQTEGSSGYDSGQWFTCPSGTTDYKFHSHFWTSSFADLNYGADPAKAADNVTFKAMVSAAEGWIDKGVDGFRLDAVKHIYHNATSDENPTFLNVFYTTLNDYYHTNVSASSDIYMVGENLSEYNEVAPYYRGLPAMFDFSSWYRLEYVLQNSHAKWFPKDMINYERVYSSYRSNYIDATKLSNHDEDRARSVVGGGSSLSLNRCKMACAVLMTSAGNPFVYYGEEIGMYGKKDNGDEGVREPMLWAPSASDSYRCTWHSPQYSTDNTVGNVESQSEYFNSILNWYKFFIKLRNNHPALAEGTMSLPDGFNDSDSSDKNFMVFYRTAPSEKLLVIHNVSESTATYVLEKSIAEPVADTGLTTLTRVSDTKYNITMPAYSSIIIKMP